MIYFYKSISPKRIENLHGFLDFFFTKLFAASPPKYSQAHYITPNFVAIVNADDEYFDKKLKKIVNVFLKLPLPEKNVVQNAYTNNNAIIGICNGTVRPIKYIELPEKIRKPLKSLYNALWSRLSHDAAYLQIKNSCGNLKKHFQDFRKVNTNSVCPFCGMETLLNEYDKLKNAYDHYVPKGKYPFCSINFKNLAPICDNCNKSGNKGQKDIPFLPGTANQEILYFPYDSTTPAHQISLSITSASPDLSKKRNWTLNIDCTPNGNTRRKNRWVEIYNIEDRYKSKIAKDSYSWKDDILTEYRRLSAQPHFDINRFKGNVLARYNKIFMKNNGIIEKCFHEYYLNQPNFDQSMIRGMV